MQNKYRPTACCFINSATHAYVKHPTAKSEKSEKKNLN